MTWSRLFVACVVLCFSVVGCQAGPPVMMMHACELNSDCTAPLVCVDFHCQAECVSQHDCLRGTHCTIVDGAGSCLIDVPLDHASAPCGTGRPPCADAMQVCRNDTCWDACTTSADCVPDSYCQRGVCVNPDSPGFGYGLRVACSSCVAGEICATNHGTQATCMRPCTTSADCADVAATAICAAIDDPMQPAGTMACVIGCDPVRQTGCMLHDRCEVNVAAGPSGMETFLDCRAPTGTGIPGAACGTTTPDLGSCGDDLGCAPAMADMTGGYQCRHFCVVDGDCHDATLGCTGPVIPNILNTDVVVGVLHMCEAI